MRAHPQELVDRAARLARWHPLQDVAAILGVQPSQITSWKKRGWKAAERGRSKRPVPEDFAWMAGRMTFAELTRHYRAGNSTVLRWLREAAPSRRSRKGDVFRRDPRTGLRQWQLRALSRENQRRTANQLEGRSDEEQACRPE